MNDSESCHGCLRVGSKMDNGESWTKAMSAPDVAYVSSARHVRRLESDDLISRYAVGWRTEVANPYFNVIPRFKNVRQKLHTQY